MSGTGNELDAALLRLRTLVGAPSGDTLGMLAKACEEIEKLRLVVGSRLCGFCGWSIGNDDPQWQERLTEHLLACEKHPLKKACDKIDRLAAANACLQEQIATLEALQWDGDRLATENAALRAEVEALRVWRTRITAALCIAHPGGVFYEDAAKVLRADLEEIEAMREVCSAAEAIVIDHGYYEAPDECDCQLCVAARRLAAVREGRDAED